MSLVSEPAIFTVSSPKATTTKTSLAAPITQLEATEATYNKIVLTWPEVSDATDYKLQWDKGDHQQQSLFYVVA